MLQSLPVNSRILAMDVSKSAFGLALSDANWVHAMPLLTIKRKKLLIDKVRIQELIQKWQITGIIAGLPLNMDGSYGKAAQAVQDIMAVLATHINLPYVFWDERLSTDEAKDYITQSPEYRRYGLDACAACIFLQSALDHHNKTQAQM